MSIELYTQYPDIVVNRIVTDFSNSSYVGQQVLLQYEHGTTGRYVNAGDKPYGIQYIVGFFGYFLTDPTTLSLNSLTVGYSNGKLDGTNHSNDIGTLSFPPTDSLFLQQTLVFNTGYELDLSALTFQFYPSNSVPDDPDNPSGSAVTAQWFQMGNDITQQAALVAAGFPDLRDESIEIVGIRVTDPACYKI